MRRAIVAAGVAVLTAVAGVAAQATPPARVIGFADVGYVASGRDVPEGFRQGRVLADLLLRPTARWTFLGEVEARARSDALDLSLERLLLRYEVGQAVRFSIGRHRTPLGYWNANVHPAAWLRTTIDPPAPLDRTRGILPLHWFGVIGEGRLDAGGLGLGMVAGLGNGRDADYLHPSIAGDPDGHRSWTAGLNLRPSILPQARLGFSMSHDRIAAATGDIDEEILVGHFAWESSTPEILAEYMRIEHDPVAATLPTAAGETFSTAYYVQAAARLPGRASGIKPYARFETVDAAPEDSLLVVHGGDYRAAILGVRYDFGGFGAFKAEYRNEQFEADTRDQSVALQLAFTLAGVEADDPVAVEAPVPVADPPPTLAADSAPADAGRTADDDDAPADSAEAPPAAEADEPEPRPDPAVARLARAVAVVVHPGTNVDGLSLVELRRIFRGGRQFWRGGRRIVLVVPSLPRPQRRITVDRLYTMDESEFRHYWLSRIFSSTAASGPKMVEDVATARRLVAALEGAIAVLPANAVGRGMRVLAIDGRMPGEAGYPLQ